MLVGIIPTRAIYFWAYSTTKERLAKQLGDSPVNHLISAFSAGITSNTLTNPLWMVKSRFQLLGDASLGQRAFANYRDVIRSIWIQEGPPGFFKGLTASYVGCFEGAIHWVVYEQLKARLQQRRVEMTSNTLPSGPVNTNNPSDQSKATPTELFFAAAVSKFTAISLTYPHEVVRTRLREQAANGVFRYSGFFPALSKIAHEEGTRGLYSGLGMHLLRSVPNAAIMFASYEIVGAWLKNRQNQHQHHQQDVAQQDQDGIL